MACACLPAGGSPPDLLFADNDIVAQLARGKRIAQAVFCVAAVALLTVAYLAWL